MLSDVGNVAATLSKPPYVETGSTAAFPASGTATCTASLVLAPAGSCTQSFIFTPATAGAQTAKVVFSTTAGQSATANFSATATNLVNTALTIAPLGTTASYGQTVTYAVTLTPSLTIGTPTGTINFLLDGKALTSQSVGTGPYMFSVSTFVGVHSIAADYTGDTVYGGSNAPTLLTVGKATTSIAPSYSQSASGTTLKAVVTPASTGAIAFTGNVQFYIDNVLVATIPVSGGNRSVSTTLTIADGSHSYYATYTGDANYAVSTSTPVQTLVVARAVTSTSLTISSGTNTAGTSGWFLDAAVTSATPGTPTGIVTLYSGTTVLGSVNFSTAVNGVVSFFTTTTTYTSTSYVFTATYSGDGLYEPSSSLSAKFLVIAPVIVHLAQGAQDSSTITVAPVNGYTGTLYATCNGLPANALCRPYGTPVVISGTTPVTFTLLTYSGVNPNVSMLARPGLRRSAIGGVTLAILLLVPFVGGRRRRDGAIRKIPYLLALVFLPVLAFGVAGCGVKTPAYSPVTYTTPAGSYPITLTLTDTNGVSQSNIFTLVIAP
jgi:Bacterial Ig-like domain (group 3)